MSNAMLLARLHAASRDSETNAHMQAMTIDEPKLNAQQLAKSYKVASGLLATARAQLAAAT